MDAARTIAVVTGTRAEFGLLQPIMRAVDAHPSLALRVVVTGTHLTTNTKDEITAAGFTIDAEAPMQRAHDTGRHADARALGRGVEALTDVFARLEPDVVLVLGDRIEAFAAASAASVSGHRIAHVHGGDRAEGVADEAMRHAISKLAHLHLPATAQSRKRLMRMGEAPEWIFHVGSPALDGLGEVRAAEDAPALIVMQHPIGEAPERERAWMAATLEATRAHTRLVMSPNHDPGRDGIVRAIEQAGVEAVDHLPRERFLSLLKGAQAIVGNSSAGLIEAAGLKRPAVNVGPRQAGREKPRSVVDCDYGEANVRAGLDAALALDLRRLKHPYGSGAAGPRIAELLATLDMPALPLRKRNAY